MRHIDRLPSPEILAQKHVEWQRKFEEKLATHPKARPDNSKYGHKDILNSLFTMSYGKCFYCERTLAFENKEIDHQIEVAIDPSKAYEWDNLYLACSNCNDKLNHAVIPIQNALDPCRDSDEIIAQNLTFNDELIQAKNGSQKGLNTIKKYKLNTELLDYHRLKVLKQLIKVATNILKRMISEHRDYLNEDEKNSIKAFMQPDHQFSLMCKVYIEQHLSKVLD